MDITRPPVPRHWTIRTDLGKFVVFTTQGKFSYLMHLLRHCAGIKVESVFNTMPEEIPNPLDCACVFGRPQNPVYQIVNSADSYFATYTLCALLSKCTRHRVHLMQNDLIHASYFDGELVNPYIRANGVHHVVG